MQNLLLIAGAGALGTLSRYGLGLLVTRLLGPPFPWGTFVVNVLGCFLFGFVWEAANHRLLISPEVRNIILVGFMGAFTTFSTFIFNNHGLLHKAQWMMLAGNLLGQNLLGLVAVFLGLSLARTLAP